MYPFCLIPAKYVEHQASAKACTLLDFSGAPKKLPEDNCIISPYNGMPGFPEYTFVCVCSWNTTSDGKNYVYKIYTYDVAVPEGDRICEYVFVLV